MVSDRQPISSSDLNSSSENVSADIVVTDESSNLSEKEIIKMYPRVPKFSLLSFLGHIFSVATR